MKVSILAASSLALILAACTTTAQKAPQAPIALIPDYVIEGRAAPTLTVADEMARLGVRTLAYKTIRARVPSETVVLGETPANVRGEPLFQVASISKSVSAMGVLRLVDARGLDLDGDVNRYLKRWQVDYTGQPAGTKVTIRQLLAHTAGLTVHGFPGYAPGEAKPDTVGVLKGTGNTEKVMLFQAPGKGFSYSGGGTTVLQLLVEDVTGKSFADYIAGAVLTPFGMSASHYRDDPGAPYVSATGGRGEDMGAPYHVYPEKAAASLWTTPSDLARFLLTADAVIGGARPDLLAPAIARQIAMVPGGAGNGYALGFSVDARGGKQVIGHNGSNFGYKSLMFLDRKSGDGFIAMSGSEQGFVLAERLARGFAQQRGLDYLAARHIVPVAQSEADWARIVGTWTIAPGTPDAQTFKLERAAPDTLRATNTGNGESYLFYATGPLAFDDPEKRVPLSFTVGAYGRLQGQVYGAVPLVRVD